MAGYQGELDRKKVQLHGGSETQPQRDIRRFQTDRQTCLAVQVAVWKVFDGLEALTERWPTSSPYLKTSHRPDIDKAISNPSSQTKPSSATAIQCRLDLAALLPRLRL
jgi:hypothetical protein